MARGQDARSLPPGEETIVQWFKKGSTPGKPKQQASWSGSDRELIACVREALLLFLADEGATSSELLEVAEEWSETDRRSNTECAPLRIPKAPSGPPTAQQRREQERDVIDERAPDAVSERPSGVDAPGSTHNSVSGGVVGSVVQGRDIGSVHIHK